MSLRNKWHIFELPSEEHSVSQRDVLANRCPVWASGPGAAKPADTPPHPAAPPLSPHSRHCARILWWHNPGCLFLPCQQDWWMQKGGEKKRSGGVIEFIESSCSSEHEESKRRKYEKVWTISVKLLLSDRKQNREWWWTESGRKKFLLHLLLTWSENWFRYWAWLLDVHLYTGLLAESLKDKKKKN